MPPAMMPMEESGSRAQTCLNAATEFLSACEERLAALTDALSHAPEAAFALSDANSLAEVAVALNIGYAGITGFNYRRAIKDKVQQYSSQFSQITDSIFINDQNIKSEYDLFIRLTSISKKNINVQFFKSNFDIIICFSMGIISLLYLAVAVLAESSDWLFDNTTGIDPYWSVTAMPYLVAMLVIFCIFPLFFMITGEGTVRKAHALIDRHAEFIRDALVRSSQNAQKGIDNLDLDAPEKNIAQPS